MLTSHVETSDVAKDKDKWTEIEYTGKSYSLINWKHKEWFLIAVIP